MKIAIIWAGPGGLSAGLILQNRGHEVTIYEKDARVGGRNATIEHDGFRHDVGPTFLMYPDTLRTIFELAGERVEDHVKMTRLEPMYRLTFPSDRTLDLSDDPETMVRRIEEVFPGESAGYRKYMDREGRRWRAMKGCLEKPYVSLKDFLDPQFLRAIPHFSLWKTVHDVLSSYFSDDEIKLAFSFQSKYLGMSPWACPWAFTMLAHLEHAYGIWHVEGGLSSISESMARLFVSKGGDLRLSAPVRKIVTENRNATGVRTDEKGFEPFDRIVVNADFSHAVTTLFEPSDVRKYRPEKLRKKGYSCSTFMAYLELDGIYPDEPHHNIIFGRQYRRAVDAINNEEPWIEDFSVYVRNACVTDPTIAPEGKSSLYLLVPVPNARAGIDWEARKDEFLDRVIDSVAERTGMKDLRSRIRYRHVITPTDWVGRGVYEGATFNLAHSLDQMLYFRPRNAFECVGNCYLTGGGTHPGSGLPTIYQSAVIVADLLDGRK